MTSNSVIPGVQLQTATEINQSIQPVTDADGNASVLGLSTTALVVSGDFSKVGNVQRPSSAYVYSAETDGMYFFIEPDFDYPAAVGIGVWNTQSGFQNVLRIDASEIHLQERSGGPVLLPKLQPAPADANLRTVVVDINTGQLYYQ